LNLAIDVDLSRPLRQAELVDRLMRACRRLIWLSYTRSPSGMGWHLQCRVRPVPRTAVEVVALQLLLGSDPHREAYNLNRAAHVDAGHVPPFFRARWNVLYKGDQ
jgi:hypothetical protein